MKTFYIKTLGCKTNQIESDYIAQSLCENGFSPVEAVSDADIFILNSCSVTSNADSDAVRILKRAKRENPNIYNILTGCFAQLEGKNLEQSEFVDLVLGNTEKNDILTYLENSNKINVSDIFEQKNFIYRQIIKPTKTRAYLKIQDGCNNRCSYCTIWKARGKSRSSELSNISEQIKIYTEHDFSEVVLTGIHIGQWGEDLNPKKSFLELIEVLETSDIKRYRLGSLNPFELTTELLEYLSQSQKFCPHFHLSLQSACNKTLKAMNRHYTVEHYLEQIDMINEKFNLPFIGSDIIVGFPNETDDDFEITRQNIKKSGLTMAHIFPYSIRKNTIAAEMENQVEKAVKSERAAILKEIVEEKYATFIKNNLNTMQEVLFERNKGPKDGLYKGLTKNYITVYAPSLGDVRNTIHDCVLTNYDNKKMFAKIVL